MDYAQDDNAYAQDAGGDAYPTLPAYEAVNEADEAAGAGALFAPAPGSSVAAYSFAATAAGFGDAGSAHAMWAAANQGYRPAGTGTSAAASAAAAAGFAAGPRFPRHSTVRIPSVPVAPTSVSQMSQPFQRFEEQAYSLRGGSGAGPSGLSAAAAAQSAIAGRAGSRGRMMTMRGQPGTAMTAARMDPRAIHESRRGVSTVTVHHPSMHGRSSGVTPTSSSVMGAVGGPTIKFTTNSSSSMGAGYAGQSAEEAMRAARSAHAKQVSAAAASAAGGTIHPSSSSVSAGAPAGGTATSVTGFPGAGSSSAFGMSSMRPTGTSLTRSAAGMSAASSMGAGSARRSSAALATSVLTDPHMDDATAALILFNSGSKPPHSSSSVGVGSVGGSGVVAPKSSHSHMYSFDATKGVSSAGMPSQSFQSHRHQRSSLEQNLAAGPRHRGFSGPTSVTAEAKAGLPSSSLSSKPDTWHFPSDVSGGVLKLGSVMDPSTLTSSARPGGSTVTTIDGRSPYVHKIPQESLGIMDAGSLISKGSLAGPLSAVATAGSAGRTTSTMGSKTRISSRAEAIAAATRGRNVSRDDAVGYPGSSSAGGRHSRPSGGGSGKSGKSRKQSGGGSGYFPSGSRGGGRYGSGSLSSQQTGRTGGRGAGSSSSTTTDGTQDSRGDKVDAGVSAGRGGSGDYEKRQSPRPIDVSEIPNWRGARRLVGFKMSQVNRGQRRGGYSGGGSSSMAAGSDRRKRSDDNDHRRRRGSSGYDNGQYAKQQTWDDVEYQKQRERRARHGGRSSQDVRKHEYDDWPSHEDGKNTHRRREYNDNDDYPVSKSDKQQRSSQDYRKLKQFESSAKKKRVPSYDSSSMTSQDSRSYELNNRSHRKDEEDYTSVTDEERYLTETSSRSSSQPRRGRSRTPRMPKRQRHEKSKKTIEMERTARKVRQDFMDQKGLKWETVKDERDRVLRMDDSTMFDVSEDDDYYSDGSAARSAISANSTIRSSEDRKYSSSKDRSREKPKRSGRRRRKTGGRSGRAKGGTASTKGGDSGGLEYRRKKKKSSQKDKAAKASGSAVTSHSSSKKKHRRRATDSALAERSVKFAESTKQELSGKRSSKKSAPKKVGHTPRVVYRRKEAA